MYLHLDVTLNCNL